jgi:MFS family permease
MFVEVIAVTLNKFRSSVMNTTDRFPIEFPPRFQLLIDATMASTMMEAASEDPETLFKFLMGTLVATAITAKAWPYLKSFNNWIGHDEAKYFRSKQKQKPPEVLLLQKRYLPVFYLFRMSFWMSGPYFYQVYLSKKLRHMDGTTSPATSEFVAKVSLVGYLAIVLLGPMVGRAIDRYGRKTATVCTGAMYALGSLTVFSNIPIVLYFGRAVASVASSRLTSTPEAWLIQEYVQIQKKRKHHEKKDDDTDNGGLAEIFGLAYGGDAIVAILAGQTASLAASEAGHPTGPFLVSPLFVTVALLLTIFFWVENKGTPESNDESDEKQCNQTTTTNEKLKSSPAVECTTMRAVTKVIFSDPKILLVGLVQSLFEGSMYIFVLAWPPVLSNSIRSAYGPRATTPFGTIFSCFMACGLLGSVLFGQLQNKSVDVKRIMAGILLVSTMTFSWSVHAIQTDTLFGIISAFFAFEACVGMYFPSIGTIRSELLPEKHRCAITTLFAVPLNVLVVGVISFQPTLGNVGSLTIATFAMGVATMCMVFLERKIQNEEDQEISTVSRHWTKLRKATLSRRYSTLSRRHSSCIPNLTQVDSFCLERLSFVEMEEKAD